MVSYSTYRSPAEKGTSACRWLPSESLIGPGAAADGAEPGLATAPPGQVDTSRILGNRPGTDSAIR
ncbi:hypothetical protein HC928_13265 [bacterium]|nr:hypothetical protein [bacterium]